MERRAFTRGLAGLGIAAMGSPAMAFRLRGRQVQIEAKILIVREAAGRGFTVDLTKDYPEYSAKGGVGGGLSLNLGLGSGEHPGERENRIGSGLRLRLGTARDAPSIEVLAEGAEEAGQIGLIGDSIIHVAKRDTYDGVNRVILGAGSETAVIDGLKKLRREQRTSEIPALSGIPLIGQAFFAKKTRSEQREIIIIIKPRLIRDS